METEYIVFRITGQRGGKPISLTNFSIPDYLKVLENISKILNVNNFDKNNMIPQFEDGSFVSKFLLPLPIALLISSQLQVVYNYKTLDYLPKNQRDGVEGFLNFNILHEYTTTIEYRQQSICMFSRNTSFEKTQTKYAKDEGYIVGKLHTIGGKNNPSVKIEDKQSNKTITIHTSENFISNLELSLIYKVVKAKVSFERDLITQEINQDSYRLINLDLNLPVEEAYNEILEHQKLFKYDLIEGESFVDYVRNLRGVYD